MVLTRQGRQVSSSVLPFLPLFLRAPVVHGNRRGGKELGIPTGKITLLHTVFTNSPGKQCTTSVRPLWVCKHDLEKFRQEINKKP